MGSRVPAPAAGKEKEKEKEKEKAKEREPALMAAGGPSKGKEAESPRYV